MNGVELAPSDEGNDSRRFWDEWNREWRFRERPDEFMQRQMDIAVGVARAERLENARILGVGCGTGWLESGLLPFGEVWGTDLSSEAIAEGRRRYPSVRLFCGDFLRLDLREKFNLIVSSDSLAPMEDHEACIQRIAELLAPAGVLLLMTQNPAVWRRRSKLRNCPAAIPHALPREWPSLRRIRALLAERFSIEGVTTICPGGDRGVLWWVENQYVERVFGHLLGQYRWMRALETVRLGRELVIVARRRDRPSAGTARQP